MARAATDIRLVHYHSITATNTPAPADLEQGEIAINLPDRAIYTKEGANIIRLNPLAAAINNTLTSTSTTESLSAAQGKVLKDLIDGMGTIHSAPDIAGRDALATAGTVDNLDVVHVADDGDSKWARYQNLGTSAAPAWTKISDEDALSAGLGATNIGYTASPTQGVVTNTSGSDGTIPAADATNAGLLLPAEKTKLAGLTTPDLGYTASATQGLVTNAGGTDATLPLVTTTNAGLQAPADKAKSDLYPATVVASTVLQGNAAGTALEFNNVLTGGTF